MFLENCNLLSWKRGFSSLIPAISNSKEINNKDNTDDKFLKIVKNITSKGFVRSKYEEKLIDLSDVRINLKTKINSFL